MKADDILDIIVFVLLSTVALPFVILVFLILLVKKEIILCPLEKFAEKYFDYD